MVEITFEEPAGSGQLQAIAFDATTRETHESTATATEHPVELGVDVTDHVRKDLDTLELQVVVSNTPVRAAATQMDGVAGLTGSVEIVNALGLELAKAQVLIFSGEFDRTRAVYEELTRIQREGIIVGVITSLREYENMVILRVSPIRTATDGNSLVATVSLREIRVVESEIVEAPVPEEPRGRVQRSRGRNGTDEGDENQNSRNQSWLAQGADVIRGFIGPNESAPPPPPL